MPVIAIARIKSENIVYATDFSLCSQNAASMRTFAFVLCYVLVIMLCTVTSTSELRSTSSGESARKDLNSSYRQSALLATDSIEAIATLLRHPKDVIQRWR